MSSIFKGVVVALATIAVIVLQVAIRQDHVRGSWHPHDVAEAVRWGIELSIVAIPFGVYLGTVARRLREDRVVTLVGLALAVLSALSFLTHDSLFARNTMITSTIPIVIAALALERWTRPAVEIPMMRRRSFVTAMEFGVLASLVVAAAVTAMFCLTTEPQQLEPHAGPYAFRSSLDPRRPHLVFLFLASHTVPVGAFFGWAALRIERARLALLFSIGALAAIWIACITHFYARPEPRGMYLVSGVLAIIAIERFTRKRERVVSAFSGSDPHGARTGEAVRDPQGAGGSVVRR